MTIPLTGRLLFGESCLNSRRKYQRIEDHYDVADVFSSTKSYADNDDDHDNDDDDMSHRPRAGSIADRVFGYMYEEELEETEDDLLYRSTIEMSSTNIWNPLNAALFVSLTLATAASAVPVTLVSSMSGDLFLLNSNNGNNANGDTTNTSGGSSSVFAARAAAAAVLGTSVGKFINGPIVDVLGARRTAVLYSVFLSLSLVILAASTTVQAATWACFFVEFSYSVQWPCSVVTLATHYRGNSSGMYEGGIYLTSLARLGSLLGIPLSSVLLHHIGWRVVALLGAWVALVGSSVTYLFVFDAPGTVNQPQNPVDPVQLRKWLHSSRQTSTLHPQYYYDQPPPRQDTCGTLRVALRTVQYVVQTNLMPSVQHVLRNGTFWIVALAHTGASMVQTSGRVLGSYLFETSTTLTEHRAAGFAVFLSAGTVAGLLFMGNAFAGRQERERKRLVSRLYMAAIGACYSLSILSIQGVRKALVSPELVLLLQLAAISITGFGVAVQFYHIPSLVGATFGCDRGLFSSYTDGVAYGLASAVWRLVGDAVEHSTSSSVSDAAAAAVDVGCGWAYGWAAVALLLILSAILMVEFMEHYFCRNRHGGTYETIIFA